MKRIALVSRVQWGFEALYIMLEYRSKGLDICAVFTLPEEESRKHSNYVSFIEVCHKNSLSMIETLNINDETERIKEMELDYIFILGWSQLLGQELLELPKLGCIGTHPARLPKDRGRAPVTWQLIKGYHKSALTFFFIDEGVDSGDIIMQREIPLTLEDTCRSFYEKIIGTGKSMLNDILPLLINNRLPRTPQDHRYATYFPRRRPEDGIIDWNSNAFEIYNWVRGLTRPFPGAFTFFNRKKLFVWSARIESYVDGDKPPGYVKAIDEDGILVSTAKGWIYLTIVQFEGEGEITQFKAGEMGMLTGNILGN